MVNNMTLLLTGLVAAGTRTIETSVDVKVNVNV